MEEGAETIGVWLAVVCCYLRTVNLTAAFLFLLLTAAVRLTVLRLVCYGRLKPS